MSWSTGVHADHPDREWLAGVANGIESWLDRRVSTPTSQLVAGGAIVGAEGQLSALHCDRPALLMPSATYALWIALRALGVRPGDEVLIPQYDWTSSLAVVLSLGARPVVHRQILRPSPSIPRPQQNYEQQRPAQ